MINMMIMTVIIGIKFQRVAYPSMRALVSNTTLDRRARHTTPVKFQRVSYLSMHDTYTDTHTHTCRTYTYTDTHTCPYTYAYTYIPIYLYTYTACTFSKQALSSNHRLGQPV